MMSPTFQTNLSTIATTLAGRERGCEDASARITLESQIRKEIQTLDPALPVFNVRSMNDVMDASIAPRRFSAELLECSPPSRCFYPPLASMDCWLTCWAESREIGIRVAWEPGPDILKLILAKGYCSPVLELRLD